MLVTLLVCVGRICVPFDPSEVDSFNPFKVPTVSKICHEFETNGSHESKGRVCIYGEHMI